jgi:2-polyprenyl-6-methoxyphenol hydroxylase-like FAD-dependent oxidoreductase
MTSELEVPVLVAGGGSVGLSAAVFLAHHGVRPLVVERRAGPSVHPRATGIGPRSMEFFREVGIDDAVNAVAVDMTAGRLGKVYAETLASADLTARAAGPRTPMPADELRAVTPTRLRGTCSQDRLDGVLLAKASRSGATVQYSTRLVSFEQDDDGVTARLDGPRGPGTVRAQYLVAADGVHSGVRKALGIGTSGPGELGQPMISILFRADLSPFTKGASFVTCNITNPEVTGMFVTVDGVEDWIFHTLYHPDAGETAEDFTPDRCRHLVRAAVGDAGVDVEVRSVLPWRPRGEIADRFAAGRVFLVGDAAHAVSPLGAFGLNTGIADAHNLAWKLAAVLGGAAGRSLLDTYEVERHPVAAWTLDQALRRVADARLHWETGPAADAARAAAGVAHAPVVHMAYRYDSAAVIDPQPELPSMTTVDLDFDGAPGSRLPHIWLDRDGKQISTLDLVRPGFTLLTGAAGGEWVRAATEVAGRLGIDLAAHRIAAGTELSDPAGRWPQVVGLTAGGALLVRPDGYVAWRAPAVTSRPAAALTDALNRVLARRQ